MLSLVRSALWDCEPDKPVLEALNYEQWMQVLAQAHRQTVTGLVYLALEKHPVQVPENVVMELMKRVNSLVNKNIKMRATEGSVLGLFQQLHPIVMKGSVCAARYPSPELRETGDIDIYFSPEEYHAALGLIPVHYTSNPDEGVKFTLNGRVVEVHSRYYDLHTSKVPEPDTPEGELVMLAAHIFKHAAGPGVGLRQICDFALAWRNHGGGNMNQVFRDAGLGRWSRMLLSFVHDYLDPSVEAEYLNPKPLLQIVEKSGNFGHHSKSREKSLNGPVILRKADTALRILSRLPFALRYAPSEAIHRVKELASPS